MERWVRWKVIRENYLLTEDKTMRSKQVEMNHAFKHLEMQGHVVEVYNSRSGDKEPDVVLRIMQKDILKNGQGFEIALKLNLSEAETLATCLTNFSVNQKKYRK